MPGGSVAGCKELPVSPTNLWTILSRRDCRNWRNNRKLPLMYLATRIPLLLGGSGKPNLDHRIAG